ncbi:MAG TPA: hypothetical protein VF210_15215 [Pseudomonadales bacterium]
MSESNAAARIAPERNADCDCPAPARVIPLHAAASSDEVCALLTLGAPPDAALFGALRELPRRVSGAQVTELLVGTEPGRILLRCRGAAAAPVRAALTRLAPAAETWTGIGIDLRAPCPPGADAAAWPIVVVEDAGPLHPGQRRLFPYDRLAPELLCLRVTPLRVVLSPDGGRLLACYRAPGVEPVRQAQRAGLVCAGRVWAARPV